MEKEEDLEEVDIAFVEEDQEVDKNEEGKKEEEEDLEEVDIAFVEEEDKNEEGKK
jgi:hypothetical protein